MIDIATIRKIGILFVVIVLFSYLVNLVMSYSWLSVEAPEGATISIRQDSPDAKNKEISKSSFSGFYRTGSYVVQASNQEGTTESVVRVSPLRVTGVNLIIEPKQSYQAVSNGALASIHSMPDGSTYYLNLRTSGFYREDSDGTTQRLTDPDVNVYNVIWNGDDALILTGRYLSFQVFRLHNGVIAQTNIPISGDSVSAVYDYQDSQWVAYRQGEFYRSDSTTGLFEKKDSHVTNQGVLVASYGDKVVFIENDHNTSREALFEISLQNKSRRDIPVSMPHGANQSFNIAWSPDGSRLLVVDANGLSVYDTASLNPITINTPSGLTSAVWESDSEVIYSIDNTLMRYSIETKNSTLVSELAIYNTIGNISKDGDRGDYILNVSNRGGALIYQTSSEPVDTTAAILAESNTTQLTKNCQTFFTNFSRLTVTITAATDTTRQQCDSALTNYLDAIRITDPVARFIETN